MNAVWKGRKVAVKVIIPSHKSDAENAYTDACAAAESEANMITTAAQGIDSQDLMVKLYGIVSGAVPAHLTRFGVGEGAHHVGLVMRYEQGGTLHAHLHPDSSSPRVPLALADQLRFMKDIAACLADLHVYGTDIVILFL